MRCSHVLHSQHRHSYLDIVVYGLCGLVLVVVHSSLERRQLGWNVVSESVLQHVHQESHIPRPKLGLPLHHELPPDHQNVVHLCAECAFFAAEGCVESRCRRCLCRCHLLLIPLVHGSEVRSQFERTNPRTSSDLRRTGLACQSPVCRPLLPARAVLACLSCSALAVRVFLFLV